MFLEDPSSQPSLCQVCSLIQLLSFTNLTNVILFLPLIWRYYSEHKWNAKVSVSRIRDLLLDPVTGKWKWPINDADEVYPGILLGDG